MKDIFPDTMSFTGFETGFSARTPLRAFIVLCSRSKKNGSLCLLWVGRVASLLGDLFSSGEQ
jgi:hypothetical protein